MSDPPAPVVSVGDKISFDWPVFENKIENIKKVKGKVEEVESCYSKRKKKHYYNYKVLLKKFKQVVEIRLENEDYWELLEKKKRKRVYYYYYYYII